MPTVELAQLHIAFDGARLRGTRAVVVVVRVVQGIEQRHHRPRQVVGGKGCGQVVQQVGQRGLQVRHAIHRLLHDDGGHRPRPHGAAPYRAAQCATSRCPIAHAHGAPPSITRCGPQCPPQRPPGPPGPGQCWPWPRVASWQIRQQTRRKYATQCSIQKIHTLSCSEIVGKNVVNLPQAIGAPKMPSFRQQARCPSFSRFSSELRFRRRFFHHARQIQPPRSRIRRASALANAAMPTVYVKTQQRKSSTPAPCCPTPAASCTWATCATTPSTTCSRANCACRATTCLMPMGWDAFRPAR